MRLDKINTEEAFRYLGYGISAPDEQTAEIAADCERKLMEVIDAKYTYKYFEIDKNDSVPGSIALYGTSLRLCGGAISEHLEAVMVWYCSQRHCRMELTGL